MEDLVVPGFGTFSEYLLPFADRFIIIGGTAVTMLKADGDQVLSRIVRTTKDIDLLVVMERVDQPFIDAFWKMIEDGKYAGIHDPESHPHYYRFEHPKSTGFPAKIELLTQDPLPDKGDFSYASLTMGLDGSLSAMVLDPLYYRFAQEHARDSHGFRVLSREGLIVLKAYAAMNHYANAQREEDDHKRGVAMGNYKKHRKDVFSLLTGDFTPERVELPEEIRATMERFASHHETNLDVHEDIRKSIKAPTIAVVDAALHSFREMFV